MGKGRADGASYDPTTDTWTPLPPAGVPGPLSHHRAVWDGRQLIVWGRVWETGSLARVPGTHRVAGARYNPRTHRWIALPLDGAPLLAAEHAAVWTGREMLVFGGVRQPDGQILRFLPHGGRYEPPAVPPTSLRSHRGS